jgi:hypothetical protein
MNAHVVGAERGKSHFGMASGHKSSALFLRGSTIVRQQKRGYHFPILIMGV